MLNWISNILKFLFKTNKHCKICCWFTLFHINKTLKMLLKLHFQVSAWKLKFSCVNIVHSRKLWRRQRHPTPVLLLGKSHGRRSLVDCSPWDHWGLDMTEWLHFHFSLSCTFMHWRRKWQSTPVFLPGESQGWGSQVGCHLWVCTESDTTEAT